MAQAFLLSASDARAEIARQRRKSYEIAAAIGVSPSVLSMYLSERKAMPAAVAERLTAELTSSGGAA